MRPLAELNARGVRTVLVDIGETLTTAGKLTADAYTALERLHAAGRIVVPVTGRPAGWGDHIAGMGPANAVVGEDGACYLFFSECRLHKRFRLDLDRSNRAVVFVGDSQNDAPMFAFFETSVGVANVRGLEGRLAASPKYVTGAASGAGFVELARHLL